MTILVYHCGSGILLYRRWFRQKSKVFLNVISDGWISFLSIHCFVLITFSIPFSLIEVDNIMTLSLISYTSGIRNVIASSFLRVSWYFLWTETMKFFSIPYSFHWTVVTKFVCTNIIKLRHNLSESTSVS